MDPAASDPIRPLTNFTSPSDPSKYIRTFAKDMAAVSGQPPPDSVAPASPEAEGRVVEESGVSLPDYDPSPVDRGDASPKEFAQEKVDLKESDSEGIFQGQQEATPVSSIPLMPEGGLTPTTTLRPVLSPEEEAAEREAVLARLRAKIDASRAVGLTAPTAPEEPAIRAAAPDFEKIPEPVLPIPQISKEPIPAPIFTPVVEKPSPIHTYSSDFADHIDASGGTTFSVLAAQSDAGQTPRATQPRKRSLVPFLAGAVMLIIGVGAIAGAYIFTRPGMVPIVSSVPSLIPFDASVEVKGTGQDLIQAIANVGQSNSMIGNVVVTYVTLSTTTGSGVPQSGGQLIQRMGLQAPSILLRNINDSSTVGVVRSGTESRPFMVLKVNSYERTFAGMLAWEPTMASDLGVFYPAYTDSLPASASASSTTSNKLQVKSAIHPGFTDAVVANYDVRILRDSSGRSLMLYGYRGKDMLIIARNEAAFTALVSRLAGAGN